MEVFGIAPLKVVHPLGYVYPYYRRTFKWLANETILKRYCVSLAKLTFCHVKKSLQQIQFVRLASRFRHIIAGEEGMVA